MLMFLQTTWFFLIGFLLAFHIVLDGMNLGAAAWHLFSKSEKNRKAVIESVGPFWDGNEVWLLAGGGALFAAFPKAYAVVFSVLYIPMTLLLLALITRAVSVEVRSKIQNEKWRSTWDAVFSIASLAVILLLGVAFGNVIRGLPMDDSINTVKSFAGMLNPFALLTGITALVMVSIQGAIFTALRTDGEIKRISMKRAVAAWPIYLALYLALMIWSLTMNAHLADNYIRIPALWLLPVLALALMIILFYNLKKGRIFPALLASSAAIIIHLFGAGMAVFPRIATLTIYDSSSSEKTLGIMLVIAMIGIPLAFIYTVYVFRKIKGWESPEKSTY